MARDAYVSPADDAGIRRVMATIRRRESGNNYRARNPHSTASGAYQFINSTWRGLGGSTATAAQATPEEQDRVAFNYVKRLLTAGGGSVRYVFKAWFTGNGNHREDVIPAPEAGNRITVGAYADKALDDYEQQGGSVSGTSDPNDPFGGSQQPLAPSGGSEGTTATPDPGLPADATPEQVAEYVRQHYGMFAGWLDHGELGPLLLQAAQEGWSQERLIGAISATTWWQTTTEAQRRWDLKVKEDIASANADRDAKKRELRDLALSLGVPLTEDRIAHLAELALMNGWDRGTLTDNVLQGLNVSRIQPGAITATADMLRQTYAANLIPVTESSLLGMARRIHSGEMTPEGVRSAVLDQVRSRFATNEGLLQWVDQGGNVVDYFAPARAAVADVLELEEGAIDLMDKRWSWVIEVPDGQGGLRQPARHELLTLARKDRRWKETDNFRERSSALASGFLQAVGF